MTLSEPLRVATILVVDDDALIAMNTVDMLTDLGHRVLEANSGQQALAILERGERVDAIITDYAMPGMTGIELAQKARQIQPHVPVLLATGYTELPEGGVIEYPRLDKPFDERQLALSLDKVLAESRQVVI